MKTFFAVVVALICMALLFPHSAGNAAAVSSPAGRYAVVDLSPGEFALMFDTSTGAVWRFGYGDYCQSKIDPSNVRYVEAGELCTSGEDSISHIPMFQRVSVEGLYATPLQKFLDQSTTATIMRSAGRPKQ